MRVPIKDLKKNDVIRYDHKSLELGSVIAVVVRVYTSGGKYWADVNGSSMTQRTTVRAQLQEGTITELLWREEKLVKSGT